jgi:hexosaminidase
VLRDGDLVRANVALPGLAMHYTLDGSEPHAGSPRYEAPLRPGADARVLRIATFDTRGRRSRIVTLNLDPLD